MASVGGHRVAVGNAALMERERVTLDEKMKSARPFREKGNSLVLTAADRELKVLMGFAIDTPGVEADLLKLKTGSQEPCYVVR